MFNENGQEDDFFAGVETFFLNDDTLHNTPDIYSEINHSQYNFDVAQYPATNDNIDFIEQDSSMAMPFQGTSQNIEHLDYGNTYDSSKLPDQQYEYHQGIQPMKGVIHQPQEHLTNFQNLSPPLQEPSPSYVQTHQQSIIHPKTFQYSNEASHVVHPTSFLQQQQQVVDPQNMSAQVPSLSMNTDQSQGFLGATTNAATAKPKGRKQKRTPEERQRLKEERAQRRKEKKSVREKQRRGLENELLEQAANLVGLGPDQRDKASILEGIISELAKNPKFTKDQSDKMEAQLRTMFEPSAKDDDDGSSDSDSGMMENDESKEDHTMKSAIPV